VWCIASQSSQRPIQHSHTSALKEQSGQCARHRHCTAAQEGFELDEFSAAVTIDSCTELNDNLGL
jgi:hypothetical protein